MTLVHKGSGPILGLGDFNQLSVFRLSKLFQLSSTVNVWLSHAPPTSAFQSESSGPSVPYKGISMAPTSKELPDQTPTNPGSSHHHPHEGEYSDTYQPPPTDPSSSRHHPHEREYLGTYQTSTNPNPPQHHVPQLGYPHQPAYYTPYNQSTAQRNMVSTSYSYQSYSSVSGPSTTQLAETPYPASPYVGNYGAQSQPLDSHRVDPFYYTQSTPSPTTSITEGTYSHQYMPFRQTHIGLSHPETGQPSSSQLSLALETPQRLVSSDQTIGERRARGEEVNYGSLASNYRHIISTVSQVPSPSTDSPVQSFETPVVDDMLHRAVEGLRYLDPTRAEQYVYPGEFGVQPVASGAVAPEGSSDTRLVSSNQTISEHREREEEVNYGSLATSYRRIISTVSRTSPSPPTDSPGQSFEPPAVEDMLHRAVEGLRYLDPTKAEQYVYPGEFGAQPIASGAVASEGSPETVFVQYYEDGRTEVNPTKKKVPYETLRKHFRNSQKHIEREFGAIQSASAELAKPRLDDRDSVETAKVLDGIITRVEGLKKRLLDTQTNHVATTQASLKQRLDHLSTLESAATTDQPEYIRWTETRTDRWLVDWALRNSRDETALTLAQEKGLELLVDTELFAEIRKVEDALQEQKCAVALAWCSENKAALKKMKNSLEFELRLQEYIEIVQQGKTAEAMAYLKKHLISWYESHPQQCKQAAALLICPPSMGMSTYKELYDPQRWTFLIRTFRHAVYALYNIPTTSLLALGLSAGLSSLKLPSCYDSTQRNVDCPVCDTDGLGVLAKEVPWSHHVNSVIVCRITGKIMDGDNPPLCLPNGHVYSQRALEEQAAKNNGQVTCPKTGDTFSFQQTKKIFIS
ncbi:unnamed protein product [Rhizoctonia solani]|uniref:Macrophage erythroblast attacher n=1 Tax=Rhizoctonia solani TaxID=456999 RepID=A0A8H3BIN9_9AGAM|nr:unnamed protein product [Rhizoctonia solani]